MDPLLSIVKYIFQINKLENNDKSIKSFLKNGKSFPQFILLIFPPDENENKSQSLITPKWNNAMAYEYLSNKYPAFKTKSPNFSNEKWGRKFLLKILKILYFGKYKKELIEKSNIILRPFNVYFNDLNSIINSQYLLLILNVLTNGPTDIPTNFNDEFQPYFHIFDDDKIENKIFFLLQIQIIFNIYSERIYQLELNHANYLLLKFINFLSDKINLDNHFEEFSHILKEDFLFKFVYNYLKKYKYSKISSEMEKIEMKDINSVIKFLSTKENKFNFLIVDFENELTVESSLVLFFRTFFNSFFLKQTRKELFERFTTLLSIKYHFNDYDKFDELQNFNYFLELIHFIKENNFHYDSNLSQYIQDFQKYFNDVDIPMIVNQEILNNFNKFEIVQDMAFYQLQLIFDKLDSLPASYYIVETFLKAFKNLKSFKVPRTDLLKEKIIANRLFLKFQKNQKEKVDNEELNNEKIDCKKTAIINNETHESNDSDINNKIQQQNNENENKNYENDELHYKDPNEFWNPDYYLEMFGSNNGLLYYKISGVIQHHIDIDDDEAVSYGILNNDEEHESYGIFYYDEEQSQWLFDEIVFNSFIEKHYQNDDKNIPIISYIDSIENDVILMNSKYCSYPYSKSKQNKIIVYATYGDLVEVNDKQKPIFLYLHIPEEKNNLANLITIVFQMYVFLAYVSDINIILLQHEAFIDDQIEFIESIKNIIKGQDQIKKFQFLQNCLFDSNEDDDEKNKDFSEV